MSNHLEIIEIRDRVGQGVTNPFECLAADDSVYIVKGKSLGVQDSIKEWIGGCLGKAFGLPIPDFCAVHITHNLLKMSGDEALSDLGEGPAFASKLVPEATEFRRNLIRHVPLELQTDLLVFDAWIRNEDRTLTHFGGNPNLLWQSNRLHVIDHNNGLDEDFSSVSFLQLHVFCNRMPEVLDDFVARQDYQEKMQSALEADWAEAWNTMPEEWVDQNRNENWINPDRLFEQLMSDAQGAIWERL